MSLKKGKGKQSSLFLAPQSRKVSSKPSTSSAAPTTILEQISQLEKKITSNSSKNGDLNPLADLRECYNKATKLKVRIAAISALHNAFTLLIRQGKVIGKVRQPTGDAGSAEHSKALLAVREWTKGRWNDYQDLLCDLLSNSEPTLAVSPAVYALIYNSQADRGRMKCADDCFKCLHEPPENLITASL
jgi:hypothetical protein